MKLLRNHEQSRFSFPFFVKNTMRMKVHFIAIGGSAMHNLALAMHEKGYTVSGSDDEIREPSRSRLKAKGLLPKEMGWFPEKISTDLDAVILGMHARADNPELQKAAEMKVRIYSYPEYLYEQSKNKTRVVIGGSHGKTSITSMVMHVLKQLNKDFDYMVGAQLDGFDTMVRMTENAPVIILEGDEYLSSPIDRRPKFLWYKPHIALISGIAWDHINVFPTEAFYEKQFELFVETLEQEAKLIYCETDSAVKRVAQNARKDIEKIPYATPRHRISDGVSYLIPEAHTEVPLKIFGHHNLQNLNGARLICNALSISDTEFYEAIQNFEGAARRLQKIAERKGLVVYKDFAHSPSKLKATTTAVKAQYPNRELIALMELHTFSSLNAEFLETYRGCMDAPDKAIVYFNPDTIAHKKLSEISVSQVKDAFKREDLLVRTDTESLKNYLKGLDYTKHVLLLMSSGNFGGIDVDVFAQEI